MSNKDIIYKGVNAWISAKIDELAVNNIWLTLAARTIKRTAAEAIERVIPVDVIELLFTNHGIVDADIVAEELIEAINNAPDYAHEFGSVTIRIKSGLIQIEFPSTGIIKSMLNGNNVINFRESDIKELAQHINEIKGE